MQIARPACWKWLQETCALSDTQIEQLHRYYMLLIAGNERCNLTTITEEEAVVAYHFADSLLLGRNYPMSQSKGLVDIGSGAGFPGLALKIAFPHLHVLLLEVVEKKRAFLQSVIAELGLTDIEVSGLDWRTFLRYPAKYPYDLFCARASLQMDELVRLFKPSSPYRDATLVYWASEQFELTERERPFFDHEVKYSVGNRERRYLFFKQNER